jgi:hypothetical protein
MQDVSYVYINGQRTAFSTYPVPDAKVSKLIRVIDFEWPKSEVDRGDLALSRDGYVGSSLSIAC